jgi:ribosome biogenesis GTPase
MNRRKNSKTSSNITDDYLAGRFDADQVEGGERFGLRSKHQQKNKTARTALQREQTTLADFDSLPMGRVIQVFSRFSEVLYNGEKRLCVVRGTLGKTRDTFVVVGDFVRFRDDAQLDSNVQRQGVIERIEPRKTVLTRSDSFKAIENHPIVANADQMLLVASIIKPAVKWGLVDRMLIAAQSGGLVPILCVNKIDLIDDETREVLIDAEEKLAHYTSLGVKVIKTSVERNIGIDEVRAAIDGKITVLAGHSGVGKSSLARAVEPTLDLRIGEISAVHSKGKHTTTSARTYPLQTGITGEVIDTPGVKLFGLWNVDEESIASFFPDVVNETAPDWRVESYQRIVDSMGKRR